MNQPPAKPPHEAPSAQDESVLIAARREKLKRWREELKLQPYGHRVDGIIPLAQAKAKFDQAAHEAHKAAAEAAKNDPSLKVADMRPRVLVAGRCVQHRAMGKLVFIVLRDESGDLQVSVSKAAVDETAFKVASKLDYGDIVVAAGPVGMTNNGEICVWADRFEVHGKSLAPPPEKFHGLTDSEARYRQRYVDMYANPQTMRMLQMRSRIVTEIRRFMEQKGFTEVETPMLQPLHGGAAARPFITHHNALGMQLYLRIAPELYLKRLLVGGFTKVFELNRNFRNEGVSPRHNPEFTMLEAYEAFGSWETMAELVEEMVTTVAQKVLGTLTIEHRNAEGEVTKTINLKRPWRRAKMVDLVAQRTGWTFDKQPLAKAQIDGLRAANPGKDLKLAGLPAEQLVEVYEKLVEPTLIDPCFVTHVPSVAIPLARESEDDPFFADVYELAINGQEISPGYTELNDPEVQERHFRHQVGDREEQQQVDEDFLNALRVGMPPAGGMGLGIDRLVMMLLGAESIRDIILFPLMRPEGASAETGGGAAASKP